MDDINVLVYYDGRWDEYCNYEDYSIMGIVISIDCSYVVLVGLIMKKLKRDQAYYDVTKQYQIVANGLLISISRDSSVSFYNGIKKNESDLMKFLLCVDINLIPCIYDNRITLDTVMSALETLGLTHIIRTTYYDKGYIDNSLNLKLPTIEEMSLEICQHVTCDDKIIKESDSNVVCQPSIESINVNAIFKNKELLTTSLALHAIYYRYQFRVYKSDKSKYVLKCVDGKCEWGIRCFIIGRSAMFKIRKIKNNYTCSLDIVLGDHKQATCFVIARCIKYKFISARTVYTPADVVRDMVKTYGLSISYEKAWEPMNVLWS
ncbi:Uncharacterized protein Adt_20264 [Abeliophyllum distichum]|uniref:Transposase MuDR plant domain-containing protein n=1 Tax=Abeliophyllum distichum TaxID=126358 RepID=A0ABD1SW26_9LAMI